MKIIEIMGGLNTTISNQDYDLYMRIKRYCEKAKSSEIPLDKFSERNYTTAKRLVDANILDRGKGCFILRGEQL